MSVGKESKDEKKLWCDTCWDKTEHVWSGDRWVCKHVDYHKEIIQKRFDGDNEI